MSFPQFDEFYPDMFSRKMDAIIWFGVLCGGLSALSTLADDPLLPTSGWTAITISIYVVAGIFYAPRSNAWGGVGIRRKVESWSLWFLFLFPTILVMSLAGLLRLTDALSTREASGLAYGAFMAGCVGPFIAAIVILVCQFVSLWMQPETD